MKPKTPDTFAVSLVLPSAAVGRCSPLDSRGRRMLLDAVALGLVTPREIAERCAVDLTTVDAWLRGTATPSAAARAEIERACRVPAELWDTPLVHVQLSAAAGRKVTINA